MHERVNIAQAVVDLRKDFEGLTEITQVRLHERAIFYGRRRRVHVDHLIAVGERICHAGATDLAAAASHNHSSHPHLPSSNPRPRRQRRRANLDRTGPIHAMTVGRRLSLAR